jgi:uncharacterized membrane protein
VEKTSSGLQENVASLLCYLFGWLSGVVFLLIEPTNKTVRFHAIQSILLCVAAVIVSIALGIVFGILAFIIHFAFIGMLSGIIGLLLFILLIVLMVRAYQGQMWKLPIIGDMAAKWAGI